MGQAGILGGVHERLAERRHPRLGNAGGGHEGAPVEGSVLFLNDRVSQSDVVDVLCENHVYREQDFAAAFVSDIWGELKRRERISGAGPVEIKERVVEAKSKWTENIGYSFCLVIFCCQWYPTRAETNIS